MRDGERVGELSREELDRRRIIELMVGRSMDRGSPTTKATWRGSSAGPQFEPGKKVRKVSLEVRAGEIVALTGLVGAGRTETARLLFGADERESGRLNSMAKQG